MGQRLCRIQSISAAGPATGGSRGSGPVAEGPLQEALERLQQSATVRTGELDATRRLLTAIDDEVALHRASLEEELERTPLDTKCKVLRQAVVRHMETQIDLLQSAARKTAVVGPEQPVDAEMQAIVEYARSEWTVLAEQVGAGRLEPRPPRQLKPK